ncbi:MAG: helix-hairpin-helix domain-containing protein, partial [Thermoplasmata archaeon]
MPTNTDAAALFRGIADVLDVLGERFKPEAYRRAARSIESLTEGLAQVAARDELRSIPGVGDAIEEKIREYLRTGHVDYYDRLQKEVPPGILTFLKIPGLGPKTARRFWLELGVEGPGELADAIGKGRLAGVKGFGPKKVEQIRLALVGAEGRPSETRLPIEIAYPIAQHLVAGLRAAGGTQEIEIAGSFRRCRETVGDLDILVTSGEPERVFDAFSHLPEVAEVKLRGGTKETVLLSQGLQVDLRVVEPVAFGAALLYFTGSKDHNVRLRSLARDRGLKINEYGVFRGEERVGGRTEQEIYSALELAWIPPEIREDRGEIEAAAKGPLPPLVERTDLTGDLHCHLAPDAGERDVDALVASARHRGLRYLACVVGGVGADGTEFSVSASVLAHLETVRARGLIVGRAVEIAGSGNAQRWAKMHPDLVIVRATATASAPPTGRSDVSHAALVTHVGGEELAREWIAWARRSGAAMEVGPGPDRLDSTAARSARESKVPLL